MIEELKDKRIEDVRKTIKNREEDKEDDENIESLSIDVFYKVRILLSSGGPSDGFDLEYDSNKELMGGVYWSTYEKNSNWKYKETELILEEAELVEQAFIGEVENVLP